MWRGYIATFNINNGQLYVRNIEIEVEDPHNPEPFSSKWVDVIYEIFPHHYIIKADWFSGLLEIFRTEPRNYVETGYYTTLFEIETGNIIKEKQFNEKEYACFKEKQFLAFKQTDEYKQLFDKLSQGEHNEGFPESFLRDFIFEFSPKFLVD